MQTPYLKEAEEAMCGQGSCPQAGLCPAAFIGMETGGGLLG